MSRTPKIPLIQGWAATPLLVMAAVIMAIGIFLPMGPLAHYFKLQALPPLYFVFLLMILLAYIGLTQAMKGIYFCRYGRSEERRVGKECVSVCRSRWSQYH